jgi:galactitol-specific phosphotransferase system IIB component
MISKNHLFIIPNHLSKGSSSWEIKKAYYLHHKNGLAISNNDYESLMTQCNQYLIKKKLTESDLIILLDRLSGDFNPKNSQVHYSQVTQAMDDIQAVKRKMGESTYAVIMQHTYVPQPSFEAWANGVSIIKNHVNNPLVFYEWLTSYFKKYPKESWDHFLSGIHAFSRPLKNTSIFSMEPRLQDTESSSTMTLNALFKALSEINASPLSLNEETQLKNDHADILKAVDTQSFLTSANPSSKINILAKVIHAVQLLFNVSPYPVQLISILVLLSYPKEMKGRLAQIRTGEGKSLIIAILAAYHALQKKTVDIITSTSPLAIRDQKKYVPLYKFLGLSSGHICVEHPNEHYFHPTILFGTNTDFEFSILREHLYGLKSRKNRPMSVVIVDEADNFLMDKGLESARIAIPSSTNLQQLYFSIYKYTNQNKSGLLRDFLLADNRDNYSLLDCLSDDYLNTMYESSKVAAAKIEGCDYVVQQNKVTIIDLGTGQLQPSSRWQDGVHEFLEIKHNIVPENSTITGASLCHPSFFDQYQIIFGLTGTLGNNQERDEITCTYNVDTMNIPTRLPIQRDIYPLYFGNDYYFKIYDDIQAMMAQQRPTLILVQHINAGKTLSEYLTEKGVSHQLLNAIQNEPDALVIRRAGQPGTVTVATNIAGRGTDIELPTTVQANGGLHVIVAFYPANSRVEDQAIGRSARQGQLGSYRMILSPDDDEIALLRQTAFQHAMQQDPSILGVLNGLLQIETYNHNVSAIKHGLEAIREERIVRLSKYRENCVKKERQQFRHLVDFCYYLNQFRLELSNDWIENTSKSLSGRSIQSIHTIQWPVSMNLEPFSTFLKIHKEKKASQNEWASWLKKLVMAYTSAILSEWGIRYSNADQTKTVCEFNIKASPWSEILDSPKQQLETLISTWVQ